LPVRADATSVGDGIQIGELNDGAATAPCTKGRATNRVTRALLGTIKYAVAKEDIPVEQALPRQMFKICWSFVMGSQSRSAMVWFV
jgi:hypothetical protein